MWVGRLDLVPATFDDPRTAEGVRAEVLVEGKRGTAALNAFLDEVAVHEPPPEADEVASLEGIALADASVILLAEDSEEILLANDRGLIEVARSHGVEYWWMTTLLLKCTKEEVVTVEEATDVLYDLGDEGINLYPKVYAQVQQKLQDLGN